MTLSNRTLRYIKFASALELTTHKGSCRILCIIASKVAYLCIYRFSLVHKLPTVTKVSYTVIEWPYCLYHGIRMNVAYQIKQYVNSKPSKT